MFRAFLWLGLTSFGGPIAHMGYFHRELVVRRRWVSDAAFTDLVALCQLLPGPASSQVGFSLGLIRAGYGGALAAWMGFTLPSAVLMSAVAYGAAVMSGPLGGALLHGLQLVAVAVVAQAVYGMARTLCPDRIRASIAGVAAGIILLSNSSSAQILVIAFGGVAGLWLCRGPAIPSAQALVVPVSRRVGGVAFGLYLALLAGLPFIATPLARFFDACYRAGALVFGGGHVVLPLLRNAFVDSGWISAQNFIAGYGAAQAVPGPLFSFAAYLGTLAAPLPNGIAGAALAVIAIFLPGMLVLLAALPFWDALRRGVRAQASLRGINAAVVGLLGAALYNPLWSGSIRSAADVGIALAAFILLTAWRAPPVLVVVLGALAGLAL